MEIPPLVHVEDQFDEVEPRPANRILRDYARLDRFNCESSVWKPQWQPTILKSGLA